MNAIDEQTQSEILAGLRGLEEDRGIRVLYACESGSRAWGFESQDSDYDVRFIYALPRDHYLGIREPIDMIDLGVDDEGLDITGWELRKALRLFQKSNGGLIEWLFSPVVYREEKEAMDEWRGFLPKYFDPKGAMGHYFGLSRKFWNDALQKKQVTAKQYLYCLRALFAARWIAEKEARIPVLFAELRDGIEVDENVGRAIDVMISEKTQENEKDLIVQNEVLHAYICDSLPEIEAKLGSMSSVRNDSDELDAYFRRIVAGS